MNQRTRTLALALVFALVGLALLADRTGMLDRLRAGGGSGAGAQSAYFAAAEQHALEQGLIAQRAMWEAALAQARSTAAQLDTIAHRAPTEQIAAADIRDRLTEAIRNRGTASLSIKGRPPAPIPDDAAAPEVRIITFDIGFDARDPSVAFAIIDILENLPDLRTQITNVSLDGPGFKQITTEPIAVALQVRTIAIISGGNS